MNDLIFSNAKAYDKRHMELYGTTAIPVMLPPYDIDKMLHGNNPDFETFIVNGIGVMLRNAMVRNWEESLAKACRDYCHICMVDPMLVEAYLQMRFEEFCASVYDDLAQLLAKSVITESGKPFKSKAFI